MKHTFIYTVLFLLLMPFGVRADRVIDSLYKLAEKDFSEGRYDAVVGKLILILEIAEERGTCADRTIAYAKMGRAHYYLQQRDLCLRYLKLSDSFARSCDIDSMKWQNARHIGAMYYEMGKPDSSLIFLHRAEQMLKGGTNWYELSSLYAIMGEVYLRAKKEKTRGKQYFDASAQYAIKSGNPSVMAYASIKQGLYAELEKDCNAAAKWFRKAWDEYKQAKLVEGEMYAMKCLAKALSDCGNAEETFTILSRVQSIRDSIFRAETADNSAKYRTLYETEKKERKVAELERARKMLLLVFAVVVLALGVVFIMIWSRYRLRKQKEMDEYQAKQQELRFESVIEAEENERKRIASDLHDGVGQTMSAAKINLAALYGDISFSTEEQRNAYEKVVTLVDESCKEVRTVSHNMMPNVLLKSGLANAIRTFVSQIDGRIIKVNFYSEGLNEKMESNTEVVLYRVIQECVNNVIKHSGANHLDISLIKDEEGISATVEDNGKGFDTSKQETFEGIGLKNIISRIAYLKGTVEWESSPGKGTAVIIHIPADNKT